MSDSGQNMKVKNCLTCRWEPEWLEMEPGERMGPCRFPATLLPVCVQWKIQYVRLSTKGNPYIVVNGKQNIKFCPAHQPKEQPRRWEK